MLQAIRNIFSSAREFSFWGKPRVDARTLAAKASPHCASLVVVGLASEQDHRTLANVGTDYGWEIQHVTSWEEALAASDPHKTSVILCDRDLPGSDWREVVQTLASSSRPSCVILLSGVVDDSLWEAVIRCGGYDILAKPLQRDEVLRSVKLAQFFWDGMMKMPAYARKRPLASPS